MRRNNNQRKWDWKRRKKVQNQIKATREVLDPEQERKQNDENKEKETNIGDYVKIARCRLPRII